MIRHFAMRRSAHRNDGPGLLGRSQDEACLHAEAESIRAAFRKHFYDKQKNRVAGDCQSSTAMMLYYGFAEQDEIPGLVQRLSELIDARMGILILASLE